MKPRFDLCISATLAAKYTRRKQLLAAVVLFFSSGAAVSAGLKLPSVFAITLSVIIAGISAYTISFGLDKVTATFTKLHISWNELNAAYFELWNHWYEENAEETLNELLKRGREASELATEVPYNEALSNTWSDRIYAQYPTLPAA